ncbi:MAG TPA: hypothetical protein V6D08_17340, partial [Candidatus Obscuribacterales bacterium]
AQGGVLGVGQSLATLGRILGPVVGGAAFQYLGMASPYYIGAAAMAVAGGLALLLPRLEPAPPLPVSVETPDVLARESS